MATCRPSCIRLRKNDESRGPWDAIATDRKKRGFTSIGTVTINKEAGAKKFETRTGFFIEKKQPLAELVSPVIQVPAEVSVYEKRTDFKDRALSEELFDVTPVFICLVASCASF